MKKLWAALLTLVIVTVMSMCVMAGTFNRFWDFRETEDTYTYGFPRIKISMDEFWYQHTSVILSEDGAAASFYHRGSYLAYQEEGTVGGLLFTLGASVNTYFQDLPDFVYLGFDNEESMHYYAVLPTDYQAYMGDEEIRKEYDELWSAVEDVLASSIIKGSEKFRNQNETEEETQEGPKIISYGDYDYLINDNTAEIVNYTGDADTITIPSSINEYQVTAIGDKAFDYGKFKSVTVPGSILTIGKRAFEYCEITDELSLPIHITISEDAFSYAVLPPVVTIPEGSTVERCAFSYCKAVKQVCIDPDTVLENRAFGYCDDLTEVIVAEGCRLEKNAFEYCDRMERVYLCGDVNTEPDSFYDCGNAEVTQASHEEYDTMKQAARGGSPDDQDPRPDEEETELPPEHIPVPGEYLYQALGDEKLAKIKEEPPVELTFHVDQGGYGRTATFTEGDDLDKAVELFCKIQIKAESGEWVTDNYNGIWLDWADGSYTGIALNLNNLEYSIHSQIHTYELDHLDEFRMYCENFLVETYTP